MPEERAETASGATAAPTPTGGPAGDETAPADRAGRTSSWWWFVAPAFVVGMVVGAVALGLLQEGPSPVPPTATEAPADDTASEGASESPGASAEFTVNDACLRVVNGTQDLVDVVGDVGDAASDLDIAALNQAIRRLQPLERSLRDDLDGCETDTTLPGDISPAPGGTDASDPDASDPDAPDPDASDPGAGDADRTAPGD